MVYMSMQAWQQDIVKIWLEAFLLAVIILASDGGIRRYLIIRIALQYANSMMHISAWLLLDQNLWPTSGKLIQVPDGAIFRMKEFIQGLIRTRCIFHRLPCPWRDICTALRLLTDCWGHDWVIRPDLGLSIDQLQLQHHWRICFVAMKPHTLHLKVIFQDRHLILKYFISGMLQVLWQTQMEIPLRMS